MSRDNWVSDREILIPLFFGELIYFVLYAEFSNTVVNLSVGLYRP